MFWTSLPNLHPLVVHVPIAVLPLAMAVDIVALVGRRSMWLDRMAAVLYLVGGLGAGAAVWAGEQAADSLVDVAAEVQPSIAQHSDWGHYVWYLFGALALARGLLGWLDRRAVAVTRVPLRMLLLVAALAGLVLLARAADMGGGLVYRHGLGVERQREEASVVAPPGATAPKPGEEAEARLERGADGALSWRPIPADFAALGSVVGAAHGTGFEALGPASPGTEVVGLPLTVDGRVVLRLGEELGDVQVDAELDLQSFTGRVGVAHHLREPAAGGFFLLASSGEASLVDAHGGEESVLDQQMSAVPDVAFKMSVSSAGRHLKGMVDGETVVHGHIAAPEPGGCGLLLDGTGVVWIHSVTVTPLGP